MERRELTSDGRLLGGVLVAFVAIALLAALDLASDFGHGTTIGHVLAEGAVFAVGMAGAVLWCAASSASCAASAPPVKRRSPWRSGSGSRKRRRAAGERKRGTCSRGSRRARPPIRAVGAVAGREGGGTAALERAQPQGDRGGPLDHRGDCEATSTRRLQEGRALRPQRSRRFLSRGPAASEHERAVGLLSRDCALRTRSSARREGPGPCRLRPTRRVRRAGPTPRSGAATAPSTGSSHAPAYRAATAERDPPRERCRERRPRRGRAAPVGRVQQGEHTLRPAPGDQVEIGHAASEQRVALAEVVVDVETGHHRGVALARLVHR